jgi:uncharacterized repeat protein (TIGR02543 family)
MKYQTAMRRCWIMKRIIFACIVVGACVMVMGVSCVPALFVSYVTYDGNGSTGGTIPVDPVGYRKGATVAVMDAGSLARAGYTFDCWNTAADGSGIACEAGSTMVIDRDDITLFAQWKEQSLLELLIGTWAGEIESGSETFWTELVFRSNGTMDSLAYDFQGGLLLGDRSVRGTYELDGSSLSLTLTEIWYDGEWHIMGSPILASSTLAADMLRTGTWTAEFDADDDGVPDLTYVLTKQ